MAQPASALEGASAAGGPLEGLHVRRLLLALAIGFGLIAFIVMFGDVAKTFDYPELLRVVRRLPASAIALALGGTAISFAGFIGREATALRYVGVRAPWLAVALSGVAAPALGNAAGFGVLTGAAVRYRIYGAVGIGALQVAQIVVFVLVGFGVGLAVVGGGAAIVRAGDVAAVFGWSPAVVKGAGAFALLLVGGFMMAGPPRMLKRLGGPLVAADPTAFGLHVLWTAVRLVGAATALWALLPSRLVDLTSFVPLFAAATALGALSHVPGGLGVFEIAVLWALKGHAPKEAIAAALVAYRGIYFVLPLLLSALIFGAFELRLAVDPTMPRANAKLSRAAARLTPTFIGLLAFMIGVLLIVSGATPTIGWRLSSLSQHVPLWLLEISSFLGSIVGVVFLFLSRGLFDRRDGAWRLAVVATLASLAFSALKGLAFGEIALLASFLMLLLASWRQFERPTSLFNQPFTWGWFAAVGAILVAAAGIFWLAFHGAPPTGIHDLSAFEFDAQAPRALRATLGAAVAAGGFALWQLLRPPSGRISRPNREMLARAADIIAVSARPEAMMALMGDKAMMMSESGRAFLMYGKRGRSWIALHDPVGPREEWRELVERFVRQAAEHGGRANFYQTKPDSLPFYLDLGFVITKLGEEAIVDLGEFTLKGGKFSALRYALKRGERDGLAFELLAPAVVSTRLHELAAISDSWLEMRRVEEKGFSVAAFDAGFVSRQHVGLLTENGRPVAFASVMTAGQEATLALMRHAELASPVAMECLMTELALALRKLGYARFSLGVAPLAGVTPAPLRTRWGRLAALLWRHGNRFYNFQGLRAFKNKLHPTWEPRYLVSSGALGPFTALADAVSLIGSASTTRREREHA